MKKHKIKHIAFLAAITAMILLSGCEEAPVPVMPARLPGVELSDFYGPLAETAAPVETTEEIDTEPASTQPAAETAPPISALPQIHREPEFYRQNADGTPVFGWVADEDGTIGFCDESGYLITGFAVIDDHRYLFNASGDICTGVYEDTDGSIYQFTPEGYQYLSCIAKDGEYYYYYDETGRRVTGQFTFPDGSIGMTDTQGHLLIGSHLIGDTVYTFSSAGKLRRAVDANQPMAALTYNDGPAAEVTSLILNTLRANNAAATFFPSSAGIGQNPALIQEIDASGFEIGNYTYNQFPITGLDSAAIDLELSAVSAALQTLTGNRPLIMRPPNGVYDERSCSDVAAVEDGYPLVLWSIDTQDLQHGDAAATCEIIRTQVKDGSIILMHDTALSSAAATQLIVPELISMGYQLVTVSELAAARGGMTAGSVYDSFDPALRSESVSIPEPTEASGDMQPQLIFRITPQ